MIVALPGSLVFHERPMAEHLGLCSASLTYERPPRSTSGLIRLFQPIESEGVVSLHSRDAGNVVRPAAQKFRLLAVVNFSEADFGTTVVGVRIRNVTSRLPVI